MKMSSRSPKRQRLSEISTVEKKSNGMHIPSDLTFAIISRLSVKSLVRFQCVSKLWSSLIIDSIVVRRSTQPCLLLIFPRWLHQSSLFSSSYHEITTFKAFMSAAKDMSRGFSCKKFEYQYIRGLICTRGEYAFDRSPRILLPDINYDKYCNMGRDGFVGYDPVEDQIFTLLGGQKKQQLRTLDIQGTCNQLLQATFTGLCIDGIIYYIEKIDVGRNELVWFDVRLEIFERLHRIQLPIPLQINRLEELTLVNYQGKLACIRHTKDSAEMWIMEYHHNKKQEWSKIISCMPDILLDFLGSGRYCFAGVTPYGEIVIMPKRLKSKERLYTYYYDPIQNVIKGTLHSKKTTDVGHRYYEEYLSIIYR